MSDAILTSPSNVTVSDISAGTTVTEPTGQQTPVAGSGTPLGAETGTQSEPSGSQESTDNSQGNADQRRNGWSKLDEIKELRSWRREARERESSLQSQLQEMRDRLTNMDPRNQPRSANPRRDPSKFWQDPEASIDARLEERLQGLQDAMFERFSQSREQEYAEAALNQERQTAVEFIRSQKGYSREDDEDLIEIIHDHGLSGLQPIPAARAAWALFQQMKGIGDRTELKQRASGVIGQPPGVGLGKKIWSIAEYDQALDSLLKNPKYLIDHPDYEAELLSAQKEGRIR